jgi:hypothetical protein
MLSVLVACLDGGGTKFDAWANEFCGAVRLVGEAGASLPDEDPRLPLERRVTLLDEQSWRIEGALRRAVDDLGHAEPPETAKAIHEATVAYYDAFRRVIGLVRPDWLSAETEAEYQAAADRLLAGLILAQGTYASAIRDVDRSIVEAVVLTPGCEILPSLFALALTGSTDPVRGR